mgnify:CR=1 FL=1
MTGSSDLETTKAIDHSFIQEIVRRILSGELDILRQTHFRQFLRPSKNWVE